MAGERILVVDDETMLLQLCVRTLAEQGYVVQGVAHGQEAITLLEEQPFDLLVLDVRLPDIDGPTVLKRAREIDPRLTAVVITAYASLESAVKALRSGARGFLIKPFKAAELLAAVSEALSLRQLEQERLRMRVQLPILEISHALMGEGDVQDMAGHLLQPAVRELNADLAALFLVDERADELYLAGAIGFPTAGLEDLRYPLEQGLVGQVLAGDSPLLLDPAVTGPEGLPEPFSRAGSAMLMPLRTLKRTIGLLYLGRQVGRAPLTPADQSLLSIVGGQMATALENARLYEIISRGKREWEATFDAMRDGIAILDPELNILRINRALAHMVGRPLKTLIGRRCYELVEQLSAPPDWCPCLKESAAEQVTPIKWHDPNRGRVFEITVYPLKDKAGQGRGFLHILRDITTQERMEAELIRAEKLAALGRLVTSLAHEINNPLQALRSGFRLLLDPRIDEEKRHKYLEIAERELERLIAIVERVLGFYRPSAEQAEPTDVNALLDETLALVNEDLEQGQVVVERRLSPQLPPVAAMVDQLKQVFLNIVLNARQAMPAGGKLTVETTFHELQGEVHISFTDTGEGIPEAEIPRLFEPFYTTREGGSGLGLTISYGIVERHGGRIEVRSTSGVGSSFTVLLPAKAAEERPE